MLNQEFVSEMKAALLQKKEELEGELKNLSPHTEEGSGVEFIFFCAHREKPGRFVDNDDGGVLIHHSKREVEFCLLILG
jgi:hypothetical protein